MQTRRQRILAEGMRLFGERGYAATSIAQIEEAAGLSPGSGSLYKHFRSKRELLAAGLDELLASRSATRLPPEERLSDVVGTIDAAARGGFDRMEQDRDVNRLLFRGLGAFPELLEQFGTGEIARIHSETAELLTRLATGEPDVDWEAIAAVLQAATAHYWLLEDLYGGEHPTGVSRERYIRALVRLATTALSSDGRSTGRTDGPN